MVQSLQGSGASTYLFWPLYNTTESIISLLSSQKKHNFNFYGDPRPPSKWPQVIFTKGNVPGSNIFLVRRTPVPKQSKHMTK